MTPFELTLLIVGGFLGGLIDSIVGGGGLITVPVFLMILGPNAMAIGTNKVAAVAAQISALVVYAKNSHVDFSKAWKYLGFTSLGAIVGAVLAPYLPVSFFKWFLVFVAPVVLALVFTKRLWSTSKTPKKFPRLALIGTFFAGLYDGIAGPGGGTLLFLSLFFLGGLPTIVAMGTGKLANFGSATMSLATYSWTGNVDWKMGLVMAVPISLGAWLGAKYGSRHHDEENARKLARTALVLVSGLLIVRWVSLIL